MLGYENDAFPKESADVSHIFMHEAPFQKHLLDQGGWFWRQFGIVTPMVNPAYRCPDLLSFVNDRRENKIRFNIEVEYAAKNFITHGHETHNVHLILAFQATLGYKTVKGVPVVSYYRKCPDGMFRLSLEDDLGVVFHDRESSLLKQYGGYDPSTEEE